MSELNLPANPQVGDTYDYDSKRYRYDGIKWTTIKFVGETAISLMDNHKSGTKEHSVSAIDWQGSIGFRNLLINGDFRIWQRGDSGGAVGQSGNFTYLPDRWKLTGSSGVTAAKSQGMPNNMPLHDACIITLPANGTAAIMQQIEQKNCQIAVGSKVTFTALVRSSSAASIGACMYIGNPNAVDSIAGGWTTAGSSTFTLQADTWTKVSTTAVVTANMWNNGIVAWFDCGTSTAARSVYITGCQLEVGAESTPFEHRPYGYELSLCQRYCVAVQSIAVASETIGIGGYTTGSAVIAQYFLPVQMRAVPKWIGGGVLSVASAGVVSPVTTIDMRGSTLTLTANQTNTVGQSCYTVSSGANAGFRGFDAEL